MFELLEDQPAREPLPFWVKAFLTLWILTLPVTLPAAALSAMATEAGEHWDVDLFIWSAFTYPVSVILAFLFRRMCHPVVLLPFLNVVVWFLSGAFTGH